MNNFNARHISTFLFSIIFIVLTGCSNSSPKEYYSATGFYFDTIIDIKIYNQNCNEETINTILSDCLSRCSYYENIFSRTLETSELYKVNNSNGKIVKVNSELISLIKEALSIENQSEGLVSPSIGILTDCWKIGKSDFKLPTQEEIDKALSHIDSSKIIIDETEQTIQLLDPEMKIDLGFIAKGYIADKLKEYLLSQNITSGIINLGGNVLTIGSKNNKPYNIGIKNPTDPNSILTNINVIDKSIVSSGNYERYSDYKGIRYHHILSSKTGYPVGIMDSEINKDDYSDTLSQVTIISNDSITGDKLSTLCFILGYNKSVAFLNKYYPEVEAIFVNNKGEIIK